MKTLKNVLVSLFVGISCIGCFTAGWITHYYVDHGAELKYFSSWCPDVPNRSSWIAYNKDDNRYKCFQEWHQYPKNARGYLIPDDAKDRYPTPIDFIQRELRPDFQQE